MTATCTRTLAILPCSCNLKPKPSTLARPRNACYAGSFVHQTNPTTQFSWHLLRLGATAGRRGSVGAHVGQHAHLRGPWGKMRERLALSTWKSSAWPSRVQPVSSRAHRPQGGGCLTPLAKLMGPSSLDLRFGGLTSHSCAQERSTASDEWPAQGPARAALQRSAGKALASSRQWPCHAQPAGGSGHPGRPHSGQVQDAGCVCAARQCQRWAGPGSTS